MSNMTEVRPFSIDVPEEELVELRRRIAATRWPEKETVADQSQDVQLATIQELVRYWGSDYDLQRLEGRLNALPGGPCGVPVAALIGAPTNNGGRHE
jgi:hypothetical protein